MYIIFASQNLRNASQIAKCKALIGTLHKSTAHAIHVLLMQIEINLVAWKLARLTNKLPEMKTF